MNKAIVLILLVAGLALVEPHGFMRSPLSRTSVQTLPNFGGAQQPFWWDHTGLFCGEVRQDLNFSTCGRCGDAPGNSHAAQGGRYDKGIITGTYTAGQRIRVEVDITAAHYGFWQLELCPHVTETNNCFQRLPILAGSRRLREGTICVGLYETGVMWAEVQLPANVRCTRCTLRWTYRTSYPGPPNHNNCFDPNPAQTFRNCADIRIN